MKPTEMKLMDLVYRYTAPNASPADNRAIEAELGRRQRVLDEVAAAVEAYDAALANRENGNVAGYRLTDRVCAAYRAAKAP